MTKYAIVTTFNKQGLDLYGQKMIDSFVKNWPTDVKLYLYAESCVPNTHGATNIHIINAVVELTDLNRFKNKWKDVPKANGVCPWPEKRPKDWHKGFKWDAVRFSNKVYSIFHCANMTEADVLIWMDADMVCHTPITQETLEKLVPAEYDICYLGRENKWPECGLYSLNLNKKSTHEFLKRFKRAYDYAEEGIFKMDEWHDSFVFDEILKSLDVKKLNWSAGLIKGEGHPLINTEWGAYLDHLKGDRKQLGKSKITDLIKDRTEEYWSKK